MVTPAAKREAASWLTKDFDVSQRRACRVLSLSLATCRYAFHVAATAASYGNDSRQ